MIVDIANILSGPYSRPSCICWSGGANGGSSHTTTHIGRAYTTIIRNGDLRAVSSIYLENWSVKSVANADKRITDSRALDAQSVKWGNHKSDNGFDANKKVKGIKRTIVVYSNGFILGRKVGNAGIHDVHFVKPVVGNASSDWEGLKKVLVDRGYRGDIAKDIERAFSIDLEVSNSPNGVKDSYPNR